MSVSILVLGAGGFGLSLAVTYFKEGYDVTVWTAFKNEIDAIRKDGQNRTKLPGVDIPQGIKLTTDISAAKDSDIIIFGIPVNFVRNVANQVAPYISDKNVVVNTGKGFEAGTLKRMSVVISEEIPNAKVVVLSGPSHAEEVARGIPTTIVAACDDMEKAKYIQDKLSTNKLRIYLSDDVIGCEVGGALKNVVALCAGICDGMGFGDNTKAALMTRGIAEIARLGHALGAKIETFAGLTGIGDLIVTCTSMHSRNRRAGILIGQGVSPEEAVKLVGTVEGYYCTKAAYELARQLGVSMPITEKCFMVISEGKDVKESLEELMERPMKSE